MKMEDESSSWLLLEVSKEMAELCWLLNENE
jgi:hypothetical protein